MPHSGPEVVIVPQLLDTDKVLVSTMPRDSSGLIDVNAPEGWTTTDPSVGIEVPTDPFEFDDGPNGVVTCPGHFNCWILTPQDHGQGSVWSKRGSQYQDVEFKVNYAHGVANSQNPSVGQPISDL